MPFTRWLILIKDSLSRELGGGTTLTEVLVDLIECCELTLQSLSSSVIAERSACRLAKGKYLPQLLITCLLSHGGGKFEQSPGECCECGWQLQVTGECRCEWASGEEVLTVLLSWVLQAEQIAWLGLWIRGVYGWQGPDVLMKKSKMKNYLEIWLYRNAMVSPTT